VHRVSAVPVRPQLDVGPAAKDVNARQERPRVKALDPSAEHFLDDVARLTQVRRARHISHHAAWPHRLNCLA